jgi:hypothetical protein
MSGKKVQIMETYKEAVISEDGRYRYTLYREWPDDVFDPRQVLNFVMLNPSTADADKDDPTIRKCVGFAKLNGYNAIRVINLFAFRATNPKDLQKAYYGDCLDVVGPLNDSYVREIPPEETVVAAWGSTFKNETFLIRRVRETTALLNRKLWCLKKTNEGRPWHPLYVPYGSLLEF